jgi:calcium-independent phospholipase A2
MNFLVKSIVCKAAYFHTSCPQYYEKKTYPTDEAADETDSAIQRPKKDEVYDSHLVLVHREHVHETLKDHLLSLFGIHDHPDYQIIFHQSQNDHHVITCVLFQSNELSNARDAFNRIDSILAPLIRDGSVIITEPLLNAMILPEPLSTIAFPYTLVDLMEKKAHSHPEWHKVLHALGKYFKTEEGDKIIDEAMKKLVNQGTSVKTNGKKEKEKICPAQQTIQSALFAVPLAFGIPETESLHEAADSDNYNAIWDAIKVQYDSRNREKCKDLNVSNSYGKTPLMISIEKSNRISSMYFLLGGANPNLKHRVSGETALHFAVRSNDVSLVQMVLIFDADPSITNSDGKTPLDLAKTTGKNKSSDIIDILKSAMDLWSSTIKYFKKHDDQPVPRNSSDTFVLCLDGGGIRAFNSILILVAIEKRMLQLSPSNQALLPSYFDYTAGTSSGGLIALIMQYTQYNLNEGLALIYKAVTDVFSKPFSKRSESLEHFLKDVLGEDTVMSDLKDKRVIITSTLADRVPSQLHLMTSYGEPRDDQKGPNERKAWEAGRISSAAPVYFQSFEKKFLDGGLMANNPTIDAITEVIQQGKYEAKPVKIGLVVSVGTGVVPRKSVENVDVFVPKFTLKAIPDTLSGLSTIFELFTSEVTKSDGRHILRASTWCDSIGANYHRLSPDLFKETDPGTTSLDEIIEMMYNTKMYILSIPDKIDTVAKNILSK